jgi:hypothetical protein
MSILQTIREVFNCVYDPNKPNSVYGHYYNGSDNELENIFLEIKNLANQPVNVFTIDEYKARLNFLAEEGLSIVDVYNVKPRPFKFTKEEIDAVINPKTKKVTKKKTTKKK